MPYKNTEDRKAYNKKYRAEKGKETDRKYREKKHNDDDFIRRRRETSLKHYYKHREEILDKNRGRKHFYWLKQAYGLTKDSYEQLLKSQENKCAICSCNGFEKRWTSSKLPFVVDHCHNTNIVRGLLCDACNVMIGHAYDDPKILENAINYLNKFKHNE